MAYLLQEMESYEGITILATNFNENIDEAFLGESNFMYSLPCRIRICGKKFGLNFFPGKPLWQNFLIFTFKIKNVQWVVIILLSFSYFCVGGVEY